MLLTDFRNKIHQGPVEYNFSSLSDCWLQGSEPQYDFGRGALHFHLSTCCESPCHPHPWLQRLSEVLRSILAPWTRICIAIVLPGVKIYFFLIQKREKTCWTAQIKNEVISHKSHPTKHLFSRSCPKSRERSPGKYFQILHCWKSRWEFSHGNAADSTLVSCEPRGTHPTSYLCSSLQ